MSVEVDYLLFPSVEADGVAHALVVVEVERGGEEEGHFHGAALGEVDVILQLHLFGAFRHRQRRDARQGLAQVGDDLPTGLTVGYGAGVVGSLDGDMTVRLGKGVGSRRDSHARHLWHDGMVRIVPGRIADVYLVHHVVPLAVAHYLIIVVAQERVAQVAALHTVRPEVGFRVVLLGKSPVHGLGVVQVVKVGGRLYGVVHQLLVGVLVG